MNKNYLLAVIARHGDTCSKLAHEIGISRTTFSKKMNERDASFGQNEIKAIADRYSLTAEEIVEIFFS